jgi:multimeric flavodoxin WrbA
MKVLGINGSPRTDGNTAFAVRKALEGTGAEAGCFDLEGVAPCNSCFACKKTQKCVIKDPMQDIYRALEESDMLVLGSPIYLDHVSAQTWIFINRLYAYLGPAVENRWKGPGKLLLVATQGLSDTSHYRAALDQVAGIFKSYWDVEAVEHLVIGGCPRFGGIADRDDAIQAALAAGRRLAGSL